MTPKISVIVPVYNSGEFLAECIESLLSQTETSCEFIFVNDGSKDNSREIIAGYQKNDSRISIINQENQGVSVARNNGIAAAKGEFISFVDADDFILHDTLETLSKLADETQADIVLYNFVYQQDGHTVVSQSPFPAGKPFGKDFIETELLAYMLRRDLLNSVANKLYRRKLIADNKIMFPAGQALGEDALFNLKAMARSGTVVFSDYAGYFYREVSGSATRNIATKDYFQMALDVYAFDYSEILPATFTAESVKRLKELRLVDQMLSYLSLYSKPNDSLSSSKRYGYISRMVAHPDVRQIVRNRWDELIRGESRFRKFVLYCIKFRHTPILWLAYGYSYHRNKK